MPENQSAPEGFGQPKAKPAAAKGQYIRFSYAYNPNEERDQLTGPTYKLSPGLDPSLEDFAVSMLKMATH